MKTTMFQMVAMLLTLSGFIPARADDHGDAAAQATPVMVGTTGVLANLESDYDVDWFRFSAAPLCVYTIRVSNVSLYDHMLDIKAFAGGGVLAATTSVFSASPSQSQWVWTNLGGARSYFIGIASMFQFTTGTYQVAVSGNDQDTDGDGMADAWEMARLGSSTNGAAGDVDGDKVTNYEEYIAGTHPALAASRFAITNIVRLAGQVAVQWPATPYGGYRVEAARDLRSPTNWSMLQRYEQPGVEGALSHADAPLTNQWRHYRVVYDP